METVSVFYRLVKLFSPLLIISLLCKVEESIQNNPDDDFDSFQRAVETFGITRKELKARGVIHYEEPNGEDDESESITCRVSAPNQNVTYKLCPQLKANSVPACTVEFDAKRRTFEFGCIQSHESEVKCSKRCKVHWVHPRDTNGNIVKNPYEPKALCCCTTSKCSDSHVKVFSRALWHSMNHHSGRRKN
uniref:Piggybac transposable element-derived n=1 Tax=Caenorhabditis tropicalis TaxID=1561998 RepID=A0A1I7UAJ0_9PELO